MNTAVKTITIIGGGIHWLSGTKADSDLNKLWHEGDAGGDWALDQPCLIFLFPFELVRSAYSSA